jgi:hypothetical protein
MRDCGGIKNKLEPFCYELMQHVKLSSCSAKHGKVNEVASVLN